MAGRPTQSGPRVIVITGAARGIGRATAATLATRGHRLILADLDGELATEAAESIGRGAEGRALDVTDRSAFRELLTRVEADHGRIDVLINNAGIAPAAPRAVDEDEAMLRRTIDINLFGVMNGTLEAVRLMEPRRSGQVINIASVAGLMGVPGLAGYAASKWGVIGFTESIRAEMSGSGLVFTCVMPGPVATEMMAGTSSSPVVKLVTPEAMAERIADAVGTGKARLAHPGSSGLLARFATALPPSLGNRVVKALGVDKVYTRIDENARATYAERIERDR